MTDLSGAGDLGALKYAGAVKTHSFATPARAQMRTFSAGLLKSMTPSFTRADIVVDGVDHSGPSLEVRVFANNPKADAQTQETIDNGYLGTFNVFGHGFCFGDVGHCEINNRGVETTDLRGPHPLAPATKIVVATDAIKTLMERDGAINAVSLVPIVIGDPPADAGAAPDVLRYKDIKLVTYD